RRLRRERAVGRGPIRAVTRPTTAPELTGGRIAVRPPALVEAAQGVRQAARSAQEAVDSLRRSVATASAFGPAQASFEAMGRSWLDELGLLLCDAAVLATRVESAAVDYVRTDLVAGGRWAG